MHVVLIMVVSVNGKITRNAESDVTRWTSTEDQQLFSNYKKQFDVIVMGSHTYAANIHRIQLSKNILRIVLTRHPNAYIQQAVPGELEFSSESPGELIDRLQSLGYTNVLLTGGSEINSSFLKAKLVDELHLTVEPKLFGSGKNFMSDINIDVDLALRSMKQMNPKGTLHITYKVLK